MPELMPADPQPYLDKNYADDIRNKIKDLNRIILDAKKSGLRININLRDIGEHSFAYQDAVEILRKY